MKDTRLLFRLLEIGKQVVAETGIDRILMTAMDGAIEISGAERGLILLFNERGDIHYQTARSLDKNDIAQPEFEISRTIINRVKDNGDRIYIHNASKDQELQKSQSTARLQILSVICLPLRHKDTIFGVVYLDNRSIEGAFSRATFNFIESFADFITLASYSALQQKKLLNRVSRLEKELRGKYRFDAIVGHHPAMIEILKLVSRFAESDVTVLVQGESGTGKELVAQALHYNSHREKELFVPVNCGAITESLADSELFGHVKGAFTGATKNKIGHFERAEKGTIYLDEISELSPALQTKLLRVLETGEYYRVGSSEIRHCDVRIITASNQNLELLVKRKRFREDLFYRLNAVKIDLPPLRERRSDIPLLIHHFLSKFRQNAAAKPKQLSKEAERILMKYDFPGNVRELENAVNRAVILAEGDIVEPDHLPANIRQRVHDTRVQDLHISLKEAKRVAADKVERDYIIRCIKTTGGNITKAARLAGFDVSNFHKMVKKHSIDPQKYITPQSDW